MRFIVLLIIIPSLKTIFKKSSLQMFFQKSLFCSKHNFLILLINIKKIMLLKKKLNKFLRNISQKCLVKRYQESFVHLFHYIYPMRYIYILVLILFQQQILSTNVTFREQCGAPYFIQKTSDQKRKLVSFVKLHTISCPRVDYGF